MYVCLLVFVCGYLINIPFQVHVHVCIIVYKFSITSGIIFLWYKRPIFIMATYDHILTSSRTVAVLKVFSKCWLLFSHCWRNDLISLTKTTSSSSFSITHNVWYISSWFGVLTLERMLFHHDLIQYYMLLYT